MPRKKCDKRSKNPLRLSKLVSGGQTGADQAALDVAISRGIAYGGWIPKGRLTEAGPLPEHYAMREMSSRSYAKRTEQNVIDSDGTLIVSHGPLAGGSKLTLELALTHGRPVLHLDLLSISPAQAAERVRDWLKAQEIEILNVAGPRLSKDPDIYRATAQLLEAALSSALD